MIYPLRTGSPAIDAGTCIPDIETDQRGLNRPQGDSCDIGAYEWQAVVYMPKGSDPIRLANIRAHGAEATITDLNYDDAVRLAYRMAQEHGWIIVQDTAWEGYEDIPTWIMQGYATLALEALEQLNALGIDRPTHLFVQAGVGSYAGGVLGFFTSELGEQRPITTIVEPNAANCIFRSAQAGDGTPHKVGGDLHTLMAGLACGEPNTISWRILRDYAHGYISCPDWVAANGMRILAAPVRGDHSIISGESGAVTCGILEYLMAHDEGEEIRNALELDENATVLLISTEGDTSPATYRDIVWYGHHGAPI
jgi:diaminopropionate ammonia-lyase